MWSFAIYSARQIFVGCSTVAYMRTMKNSYIIPVGHPEVKGRLGRNNAKERIKKIEF
jgi:hypothetical protein